MKIKISEFNFDIYFDLDIVMLHELHVWKHMYDTCMKSNDIFSL